MDPANSHERMIALAVDDKILQRPDSSYESIVPEIIMSLHFIMSASDTQFLVDYAQWRLAHPSRRRGVEPEDLKHRT